VTVESLPARGRPPKAAARRAGLEFVEKVLTTKLTSTDTRERNADMLRASCIRSDTSIDAGSTSCWTTHAVRSPIARRVWVQPEPGARHSAVDYMPPVKPPPVWPGSPTRL
jgi:hypothetical protein